MTADVYPLQMLLVTLDAFTTWVRDDTTPPPSAVPRVSAGTLVRPDQVRFPAISANTYGGVARPAVRYLRVTNPLHVLGFGAQYAAAASSGVITVEPPRVEPRAYGLLVSQLDADGNDLGGVRS